MISRSDYEIWLTKWLEERLDSHQEEELHAFLSENSAIAEELENTGGLKVKKENISFRHKSTLRRSASDLPDDQFDYLCAAMVENDLGPEGMKELLEITGENKERQKTFEIFRKSKLIPSSCVYNNKNRLKKKTAFQKFLFPAVSSAAGLALLIAVFLHGNKPDADKTADNQIEENSRYSQEIPNKPDNQAAPNAQVLNRNAGAGENSIAPALKSTRDANIVDDPPTFDSTDIRTRVRERERDSHLAFQSGFVPGTAGIFIEGLPDLTPDLIFIQPEPGSYITEDERPRVEKFLTRAYRELLLGEKNDRPLNRYELAKGGVKGLNRLLGWDMAVLPQGKEEGEIDSFQFSSKILNFSVPLKKNDIQK